jgi:hypothetical protein
LQKEALLQFLAGAEVTAVSAGQLRAWSSSVSAEQRAGSRTGEGGYGTH